MANKLRASGQIQDKDRYIPISKAKEQMMAMLEELKSEIEKVPKYCMTHDATCVYRKADEYISDINNLILQKINALRG